MKIPDMLTIQVELTRKDFRKFYSYCFITKNKYLNLSLLILTSLLIPALFSTEEPFDWLLYFVSVPFVMIISLVFAIIVFQLQIFIAGTKLKENGSVLGKKSYFITDLEFKEETEFNVNVIKWTGIRSIEKTKDVIYIFIENNIAYIIPIRFIKDSNEFEEIYNHLKKYHDTATK